MTRQCTSTRKYQIHWSNYKTLSEHSLRQSRIHKLQTTFRLSKFKPFRWRWAWLIWQYYRKVFDYRLWSQRGPPRRRRYLTLLSVTVSGWVFTHFGEEIKVFPPKCLGASVHSFWSHPKTVYFSGQPQICSSKCTCETASRGSRIPPNVIHSKE